MIKLEREIRDHHILGLTFVRGEGSIHGEHKNRCLWKIFGKPMIQWVMEAFKSSKYIDKIAVATESKEIKEVLRKIGDIVIIDRPLWTTLACPRDFTTGTFCRNKPRSLRSKEASIYTSVLDYSLYYLKQTEGYEPDLWINNCAHRPLITGKILDRLVEAFFEDEEAAGVQTITPTMPYILTINPTTKRIFPVFSLPGLDRQLYPPVYRGGGPSISGMPAKQKYTSLSGMSGQVGHIEVLPEDSLDVHNEEDLFLAKCYMRRRLAREKGGDWIPDRDVAK